MELTKEVQDLLKEVKDAIVTRCKYVDLTNTDNVNVLVEDLEHYIDVIRDIA